MAKLGEICTFQSGGTPSKSNSAFFGGSIPWITTVALNGSMIDGENAVAWITDEAIQKSAAKIVPANSIMVGTRVGIGKVAINTVPMSTSQDVVSLTHIDTARWDKGFLCKFILAKNDFLMAQARGATIKGIKIETLADLDIPELTLEEQRHISTVLDKVTDLIVQRRAQLDKLDLLVKSRFVEMFGDPEYNNKNWEIVPLSTVCSVGSSKRIYQNEQSTQGIPFLRISDLMNLINTGILTTNLYIPEKRYKELQLKGQVPKSGDILVTSRGTLGQCYIIKDYDKFYFQDGMISWLSAFKDNITPLYLSYLFAMPGFHKQIDAMQAGSTVSYLSISMIKNLKVMIPDIKKQQDFAKFVTGTSSLKSILTQSLTQLQTLKRAIMQEHFEQGETIV